MFNENYFKTHQIQLGVIIRITQDISSPFVIFEQKKTWFVQEFRV